MTNGFYDRVAERYGIEILIPESLKQNYIHDKYMNELVFNQILPDTKRKLIQIVRDLKENESIQGLILGGTKLPLIISQSDFSDIDIFDTTKIHVDSIVSKMVEN